jgi:S1-C subfamily serine protease
VPGVRTVLAHAASSLARASVGREPTATGLPPTIRICLFWGRLGPYVGLDQAAGILVMEVGDGTPAAKAGLQPGDVIVRLDDKPIDTVEDLFGELRQHRPGDRVTLTLIRDGREQQRTATLADNPNG